MRRLRALWRHRDGSTAVESGFVFVIFFPFMLGLVEFAHAYWNWNTLQLAAQQGARWGMTHAGASSADLAALTCTPQPTPAPTITGCSSVATLASCTAYQTGQSLIGFPAASVSITVTCDSGTSPTTITVGTAYTYNFVASGMLPFWPLSLAGAAKMPLM